LAGELLDAAKLGSHLVQRVRARFPEDISEVAVTTEDRKVSAAEAIQLLRNFGGGRSAVPKPGRDDGAAILVTLAALGCLRLGAPRHVLADVAGVRQDVLLPIIVELEKCDLVSTSLGYRADERRLTAAAYYDLDEVISLRHPVYGRLMFDWLLQEEAADDRRFMDARGLADCFLKQIRALPNQRPNAVPDYPLDLLKPILESLQPSTARGHIQFAEELATRYLRVQKKDSGFRHDVSVEQLLNRYKWNHRDEVREVFERMPEALVRQSSVLLHSRGITRYKTCRVDASRDIDLAECRRRYQTSVSDFLRAEEVARRTQSGEHPANIITSLGHLYLGWAALEREQGHAEEWRRLDPLVLETFRKGLKERSANPAASIGLAEYLIDRVENERRKDTLWKHNDSVEETGANLAQALELLSTEPEPSYADDWNALKVRGINLLKDKDAQNLIKRLKDERDELGFVLEALLALGGDIPRDLADSDGSGRFLRQAADILATADRLPNIKRRALGSLLRYSLFSCDPDRRNKPAYLRRYELIQKLQDTSYLEYSIWLFDFAMLSAQVGKFSDAAEAFARLRHGQRFFEVPRERRVFLMNGPESKIPIKVTIRIVSVGLDEKGWGRIEHPINFPAPVPFSARAFKSRGKSSRPGDVTTCYVALNPAGPYAEPSDR
jgi:hypothetical protein